jgi:hypothetical protein
MSETDTGAEAVGQPFIIELGHGWWDCSSVVLEGRHGIAFHRRTRFAPVGEITAPTGSSLAMDGNTCIIWFDGPELGATVRAIVADAERMAVQAGAAVPGDIDVVAAERAARQRAEAERDEAVKNATAFERQVELLAETIATDKAERDRLREALRLTAMLFEQIMIAIDADPAETFLSVKIQPNGAEVKRITVAECLDKARAALGIEEPAHD